MFVRRLIYSKFGKGVISILLGLGLATLFRKVCNDKNCMIFNGPIISDFEDKTYEYDNKCYKYSLKQSKCDPNKQIIDITTKEEFLNNMHQSFVNR